MYGSLKSLNANHRYDVRDVEVEVAELPDPPRAAPSTTTHIIAGPYDQKVFVGASIGPPLGYSTEIARCGTFAAYLSGLDEQKQSHLLALTCEHVVFTAERPYEGE